MFSVLQNIFKIFLVFLSSEGDAGGEHSLYERRGGHEVLQLEIEDPLESLHTQRPQLGQFVQDPTEVVRLSLGVRVVGHMVSQRIYYFRLQIFHRCGVGETVTI